MRKFLNSLLKFAKNQEGAALVEYAVLLGIILAVGVLVFGSIGSNANGIFTALNTMMGSANPTP